MPLTQRLTRQNNMCTYGTVTEENVHYGSQMCMES